MTRDTVPLYQPAESRVDTTNGHADRWAHVPADVEAVQLNQRGGPDPAGNRLGKYLQQNAPGTLDGQAESR